MNFLRGKKSIFLQFHLEKEKNGVTLSSTRRTLNMAKKTTKKTTAKAKKPAAKKTAKKASGAKRKPNAAFMKALTPSAALAEIVGSKALPRTEVTKKLWAYIKKNNLQDKVQRRNIHADDKLKPIFGKKTVNMFEMTKLVNKHLS